MTPDNIWLVGITQNPFTKEYYLAFYYDTHAILDNFIQINEDVNYMEYGDFYEIKEIGCGGYGTVYTGKYKLREQLIYKPKIVILKRFKHFDQMSELFISEVSNL